MAYPTSAYAPASKSNGQTIQASWFNDPDAEITAIGTALLTGGLAHNLFPSGTRTLGTSSAFWDKVYGTALIVGAETTSGARLDIESGALAVREGDDSAYAPLKALTLEATSNGTIGGTLGVTGLTTLVALTATGNIDFAGFDLTASNGKALFTSTLALASDIPWRFTNSHATDPGYFFLDHSAADANDANYAIRFRAGGATDRFYVHRDGGIGNFSANNDNLSDARLKTAFQIPDMAAVWEAHKAMRSVWCLYKFKDQTHDDPNMGYTAQGIADAWKSVAPWLIGRFGDGSQDILSVYDSDLKNFTSAVVTELQWRVDALAAKVEALAAA